MGGPQDYDCIAKEILQSMGVTGESNPQSGVIECPHCAETLSFRELLSSILFTSGFQGAITVNGSFGSKAVFRSGK